jgi:uncharacterized protein
MQRSFWWLGLATSVFSILGGSCAHAQGSEHRPPGASVDLHGTAQQPDIKQRATAADSRLRRHTLRNQANSGLVTIIIGGVDSGDLSDATDLVTSLKDAHMRVLPIAGEGAKKDVIDLLFARGIDIGIVQTDVLASLKRQAPFQGVENFLQYITKLYDQEVHVLARPEIHSLKDLASRSVNFGTTESGSYLTASRIFGALGIGVETTTFPQPLALEKLRRGEIAALVYTAAKPARLFQGIRQEEGLHFLTISTPNALREGYQQTTLSAWDYPDLIKEGNPVSTLSVGTVLAVYNWPVGTERYRNVAHFVETFFARLAELRMSRHHPKWREVNIHDPVSGWTRFEPASQWIKSAERDANKPGRLADTHFLPMQGTTTPPTHAVSPDLGDMAPSGAQAAVLPSTGRPQQPSEAQGGNQVSLNAEQRDALFREFLTYQRREAKNKEFNRNQSEALFAEFDAYVKNVFRTRKANSEGASVSR